MSSGGNLVPSRLGFRGKEDLGGGLPRITGDPHFPVNTLAIMRGAVAAERLGCEDAYVEAMMAGMWEQGLKLDDPSFNAPIYANLFDDEDGEGFSLIWSRPNGRRGD